MSTISFDTKEIIKWEKKLDVFGRLAIPFAAREAVNNTAFALHKKSIKEVEKTMQLRNKWTLGSLRVNKARSLTLHKQVAEFGSMQFYMFQQEWGGTRTARKTKGIPIPTGEATGEPGNKGVLKNLPRPKNKLLKIKLQKGSGGGTKTRRQRNAATVRQAIESKRKFVYMKTAKSEGIFSVVATKRGRKGTKQRKRANRSRVRLIWNMKHRRITVPAKHWLRNSIAETLPMMPEIYIEAIKSQLRRHNVF